jgi:hypothetical protein
MDYECCEYGMGHGTEIILEELHGVAFLAGQTDGKINSAMGLISFPTLLIKVTFSGILPI